MCSREHIHSASFFGLGGAEYFPARGTSLLARIRPILNQYISQGISLTAEHPSSISSPVSERYSRKLHIHLTHQKHGHLRSTLDHDGAPSFGDFEMICGLASGPHRNGLHHPPRATLLLSAPTQFNGPDPIGRNRSFSNRPVLTSGILVGKIFLAA